VYALERTYSRQLAFLNRQHDNQFRGECDEQGDLGFPLPEAKPDECSTVVDQAITTQNQVENSRADEWTQTDPSSPGCCWN
jgi:hypothetical protein